jgi:hypothetical protein
MWYWIFKVSVLSLIFIFLLHYLYTFFISTLTIPKVKDLVTLPQQKYDELFHSLERKKNNDGIVKSNLLPSSSSSSSSSSQSMKDELIRFMKEIGGGGTSVDSNRNVMPSSTISSFSFSK